MSYMIYKIVASTFIAIAAVMLLFGIMQMFSSNTTDSVTCKLHKNVIRHIPLPGFANQPLPEKCMVDPDEERQRVSNMTSSVLAHFIVRCWEKAEEGMYGKKLECFELHAVKVSGTINEGTVTAAIESENECSFIANNWLDVENVSYSGSCGSENKIMWKMEDPIVDGTTLILKYNPLAHWVEVI
ncbi:MAG: hypothetical protein U9Q92_06500 [archaeon]|nr:hypothetical protein [archaeon]